MKKNFFSLGLVSLVIIYLFGCKKVEQVSSIKQIDKNSKNILRLNSKNVNKEDVSKKINKWLQFRSLQSPRRKEVIKSLSKNLDFENLKFEDIDDKNGLLIVPILKNFKTNENDKALNYLICNYDHNENIQKGYIIQYLPGEFGEVLPADGAFVKLFNSSTKGIEGEYVFRNLEDSLLFKLSYSKGKLSSKTIIQNAKNQYNRSNCVLWECVFTTYTYNEDGTISTTEDQLYTYYVCDTRLSTLEDGTGGGDDNCMANAISSFNQETLATTSNETIINDSYISNSPFTKIKNLRWIILKGAGGLWQLNSNETGTIKLVDVPNNIWHWETFSHSSIDMTGTTLPGVSITYTQGIATPAMHTLYASMSLNFNVTYTSTFSCQGVPLPAILNPVTNNYTSTSNQWDSNP